MTSRTRRALLPATVPLSALATATAIAVLVVVATAWSIGDAQGQVVTTATPAPPASPVFGMMQGLLGLAIVVGLIFAAGWAMKKLGPRTRNSGAVQVVGGASVGPREKVVVVRFEGRTLLLGVAPGQVSLLQSAVHADEPPAPVDAATPRFADRLRAARQVP